MGDVICVKTFGTRLDAEVAKSVLAANGIYSYICGDDVGGLGYGVGFTSGGIRLVTAKRDARDALRVLGGTDSGELDLQESTE